MHSKLILKCQQCQRQTQKKHVHVEVTVNEFPKRPRKRMNTKLRPNQMRLMQEQL
jgi:hypothetical protein